MDTDETNVVRLPLRVDTDTPMALYEDLNAVVRKYSGDIALVTVLGVLRVIEHELIIEHRD
ncbi:MAG: hypothetical protein DDT25_00136 [Chloroflexi bacterium]|nr:hypothetical protein [Chloroflexota bacterium]